MAKHDLLYQVTEVRAISANECEVDLQCASAPRDMTVAKPVLTKKVTVSAHWQPEVGSFCVIEAFSRSGQDPLTPESGAEPQWVWEKDTEVKHFIHPYNFVRIPSQDFKLSGLSDDSLFNRSKIARHDHYDAELQSGYIDCRLTTKSHWFIPDPRKRHNDEASDHKTLGYFTLDKVDADWKHDRPESDVTEPARRCAGWSAPSSKPPRSPAFPCSIREG